MIIIYKYATTTKTKTRTKLKQNNPPPPPQQQHNNKQTKTKNVDITDTVEGKKHIVGLSRWADATLAGEYPQHDEVQCR